LVSCAVRETPPGKKRTCFIFESDVKLRIPQLAAVETTQSLHSTFKHGVSINFQPNVVVVITVTPKNITQIFHHMYWWLAYMHW
jgi:hypothetical protein